ncbi:MAG: precorrin-8X methylmutase, partial [Oscillospiraceae bacterium]|nr:precorrin-8X methylmutase [Oscillospiraceae bacterium]
MTAITNPADIERESMAIIERELAERGIPIPPEHAAVVERVVHATADFDFAETLYFTRDAAARGAEALRGGVVVTDTNMARAGVSAAALRKLGGEAV